MTHAFNTPRITRTLLAIAALIVAASFAMGPAERGVATLVGAGVSLLNLAVLRWLAARILDNGGGATLDHAASATGPGADPARVGETEGAAAGGKLGASLLLIVKMALLIAIVFVLIHRVQLDPIGLVLGLGVLFIGPVVAGLLAATARPVRPADLRPEER
jgi:hypothetical protein